ncbi:organic solute transporter Ostalpha-domain-containing protein [Auriculariales sp. MPI-PUGE-AT-0066]|nr:organic solute transporter Ostalpha-domain-containing protein [Auriculariales sp. MPI-PUGE-AT-0066]
MSDHSTSQTETADGRCFWEPSNKTYTPIFHDGQINIAAHHVGWLIAGFFTIVAVAVSFWLIDKHFVWYTNKAQQRQIVRLLLMVPIYAVVSMASFVYWNHAVAIVLARDCYESFVLYSFFYLLLLYISNDPMEQRLVFQKVKIDKWMFPLGFVKWRPEDGLYFLQLMKWGVLQYCIFRPGCTLFALILEYMGYYCEESWSPRYGHVWPLTSILTCTRYCLLQLYFAVADELKPYNPILKLFAIKAVVFLTFWQASFLSVLASFGFIKDTEYMSAVDINVAIGALLETFEMMLFAFLHIKAFTYRIYQADDRDPKKRTSRWRAFRHAFWYRDMFKEFKDGIIYLWRRMRGKEAEKVMRKQIHLENAMGRSRRMHRGRGGGVERPEPKEGMPAERPDLPFLQLDPPGVGLSGAIGQELEKRGFRCEFVFLMSYLSSSTQSCSFQTS